MGLFENILTTNNSRKENIISIYNNFIKEKPFLFPLFLCANSNVSANFASSKYEVEYHLCLGTPTPIVHTHSPQCDRTQPGRASLHEALSQLSLEFALTLLGAHVSYHHHQPSAGYLIEESSAAMHILG